MKEQQRIIEEKALWEKIATNYDKQTATYEEAYRLSIEKTRQILKNDDKVLELACGTGIISLGIADLAKNIIAVDISPKMISVAKEKAKSQSISNVDFQVADGYSLPYEDGYFDVILLFNAIHIVKEPNTLLAEAYRLLKQNGYLVTATDCYAEPVPFLIKTKLVLNKILKALGYIKHLSSFRKKDVINLLKESKFEIIEDSILHAAPVNYYVLGQKK